MQKNEIKSFRIKTSLIEYLKVDDIISKNTFKISTTNYYNITKKVQCQYNINNNVLFLIGKNIRHDNIYLFESNNSILELNIKDVSVFTEVVLKEHIADLKYIEQTELFKEDEQGKD